MNNEENNNNIFYNVSEDNGNVTVEKVVYNNPDEIETLTPDEETTSAPEQPSFFAHNDTPATANEPSINHNETANNGVYNQPVAPLREEVKPYQHETTPQYTTPSYKPPKEKKETLRKVLMAVLVVIIIGSLSFGTYMMFFSRGPKKNRTFMIYMVGSDLESKGSYATFDLEDVINANIDLDNNNVVLMVGGSKKWHNFVNQDEIGLYILGENGFEKLKNYPLSTIGSNEILTTFLNYAYMKYPAKNYDLIFWNHGLGAIGLEDDEVAEDFLDIEELDKAFSKSYFNKEKLELVIFNNCLSGNIHFANIMQKYAEYMVGSEEVMYVSSIIDRLDFIENVKSNDNGLEIGKAFVDKTDASMRKLNSISYQQYDSTVSVLDLGEVSNLVNALNKYIDSIDLNSNYYNISRARMKLHTYSGSANYIYDTVDLYELVEALEPYSNNKQLASDVKSALGETIKYNKAFNEHSNGLSIYFPFYGDENYVEGHLYYFERLWDDSYLNFISNYYETNAGKRRSNNIDPNSGVKLNMLTNQIEVSGNTASVLLSDEELNDYQRGNIYIFKKAENGYDLALKSNKIELQGNRVAFNFSGDIQTSNNELLTLYDENNLLIHSSIEEDPSFTYVAIKDNEASIIGSIYDSGDRPTIGIVGDDGSPTSFFKFNYQLLKDGSLDENWQYKYERVEYLFNEENDKLVFNGGDLSEYCILVELFDVNNDAFYAFLEK